MQGQHQSQDLKLQLNMNYIIQSINRESNKSNREKRREGKELVSLNACSNPSIGSLISLPRKSPSCTWPASLYSNLGRMEWNMETEYLMK